MPLHAYVVPIGRTVKLGRKKPKFLHPALRLRNYVRPGVSLPPAVYDNMAALTVVGVGGNDEVGDCVENMCANTISSWTANASGTERQFPPADVIAWYSAITGYVPGNPATDNGTNIQDALAYWQTKGLSGDTLPGYVSVNPNSTSEHRLAVWEFGASCLGLALPGAWQAESRPDGVWDVGPTMLGQWAPYSWGGHAVPLLSYDAVGGYVATWGYKQRITWNAILAYCDEAYACASWDWCLSTGTPSGVARGQLLADFNSLGGGPIVPPSVVNEKQLAS